MRKRDKEREKEELFSSLRGSGESHTERVAFGLGKGAQMVKMEIEMIGTISVPSPNP